MLAIFAGALLGLVLAISGVDHATVPGVWRVAGVLVAFAGFMAILFMGARTWAATPVRHELDENGLRTFGPDGELRDRVRWSQMREYVIEPVPRTSILLLRITLTDGRVIRIAEGRTEERQAAFRVFCDRFVSAVDQQQDAAPDTAIREGAGFYENPVMRASGTILLVLTAVLIGASFFLPDDGHSTWMRMRLVAVVAAAAPLIQRTLFTNRPANGLPSRRRRQPRVE